MHLNHNLLLGSDLLRVARVNLDGTNTVVAKRDPSGFNALHKSPDLPEIFCIDVFESMILIISVYAATQTSVI